MTSKGRIEAIVPEFAIPGGEISIECDALSFESVSDFRCEIGGASARVTGASRSRVLAIVPEDSEWGPVDVKLFGVSEGPVMARVVVGKRLAGDLHLVSNPAVDPKDGSIVLTRSGSRGQELPVTLFRLNADGFLSEMAASLMNPTGIAFDPHGRLIATNRADGEVVQINNDSEIVPLAGDLGIATGLAFDSKGDMFVGDRSGTIFRITPFGNAETWAVIEASVSAYHMAFGPDGSLYVCAPGLCSHDVIYRIDESGDVDIFYKGLGRPQGLAFDTDGNLFVAACLRGRQGVVKIAPDGESSEMFVAGSGVVGLCFTKTGEMVLATGDAVYSVDAGIDGLLLD